MKIVYVIDSLAGKGGAERIILDKLEYIEQHFGYDVYIITCYQNEQTSNAYPVSDHITQIRLGIPFYSQYRYSYPYRFIVKQRLSKTLRKQLDNSVKQIDPDILIGVSYFEADLVTDIKCRAKKIIEVHEPRPFTLSDYGLSRGRLSSWYMRHYRDRYFNRVERHADVVVTLTSGDANEWRRARRVEVIPNFTMMPIEGFSDGTQKRVIAVGRLEWVKGYDRLISAWKIVAGKHPDWHLDLFGAGTLEQELRHQQEESGLHDCMTIHGATSNIGAEYRKSSILALSSRFEGFGLVLIEAMQIGLPCVAFDCPFGPAAVIDNGKNGFLVPDGDVNLFVDKLCQLIEDDGLRREFSASAIEKAKLYSVDKVMQRWKALFEDLTKF